MPLQIAPFQLPSRPTLTPQNLAALPKMGPPDMVEANMKGIAGIGTAFEGAYARARERGAMDQLSEYYKTHPFASPGVPGVPGVGGTADQPAAGATATGGKAGYVEQVIREEAAKTGVDPEVALRIARAEGGLGNPIRQSEVVKNGRRETSYGPFQLLIGGGLGDKALARGIDPRNPAHLRETVNFALSEAKRGGWGPWYGRKPAGVGLWDGLRGPTPAPAPVAAAQPPGAAPPVGAAPNNAPIVGGGVSRPPPVGLPPPDPTPDNTANAKAIMQQPTSDPQLKAWAAQVLRQQPGAAGQVPTANQPAPGANPASLALQTGQFTIPSTGEVVPAGSGPDRLNAGAPRPQEVVVGEDGNPVPSPAAAPPDPRRVAVQAPASAPAPGAVPTGFRPSGGDSTYAATADYAAAQRAGLVPPTTMGPGAGSMPSAAPPGAQQPGPATTGSLPPPAARQAPGGTANDLVESIASELVKTGMDPKEARVRAAGATWDDKGFRLGPYPNPAAEAALAKRTPAPAAAPAVAPGAGGGAGTPPAPAPAAAPGGGAVGGIAGAPGTFRANEALAIAARGDPQVFAAMLRQYGAGPSATGGEWTLEHDGQGNWMKMNKLTGETVPLSQAQGGQQQGGDVILPPGDPRRTTQFAGQMPNDNRTYRAHLGARGWEITPVDEREAKSFEHENQLAQGFENNKTIQNFRALTDATGSMRAAFGEGTAAGDVNGVIQVLKAIDPGSTVSQNEQGQIVSTGGFPGWATAQIARLNGGAPLTDQMRADFINAAEAQWRVRWNQTKTIVDATRNRAKANGLDPSGATSGFQDPVFPERAKKGQFKTRSTLTQPGVAKRKGDIEPEKPPPNAVRVPNADAGDSLPEGTPFVLPNGDFGESDGSKRVGG